MRGEDADPEREEYGRYGNPTVREVERRLAALEGTDDAVLFSSGMAAITIDRSSRSPRPAITWCFFATATGARGNSSPRPWGVSASRARWSPPAISSALAAAITPDTKLVISESPTNPYLSCVDLAALSARS